MRGPDIHFIPALVLQRHVARQHVQVPESQTGCQTRRFAERDGGGDFQEAEVRGRGFGLGAHAHADEFDFRDDEAVSRVAVAHQAVQVGEAAEVERLLQVLLVAHARAPGFPGLDEADDAAAAEGVGFVVGVGGEVEGAVFAAAVGPHGDVVLVALAGFEGGVHFGDVEGAEDVLEFAVVGDLEHGLVAAGGLGESGGWDGDVEEAGAFGAVGETGDCGDGLEAEVGPVF